MKRNRSNPTSELNQLYRENQSLAAKLKELNNFSTSRIFRLWRFFHHLFDKIKKRKTSGHHRYLSFNDIRKQVSTVKNWYHQIELAPGIITPGVNNSKEVLDLLDLPADCRNLRVLDLGTRDGYFAFELEKRGASVVATDYVPSGTTGFDVVKNILKSQRVEYIQDNIYNLNPKRYGQFDIVLFLGLLYHLPDPLKALRLIRSVSRGLMYIETQGIDNAFLLPNGQLVPLITVSPQLEKIPIMQFYPKKSLNNDPSNYWAPNLICLEKMLEETGFTILNRFVNGNRLIAKCKISVNSESTEIMDLAVGNKTPKSW